MNTTDRIEDLLKHGVMSLTIGVSPNKLLFVQATQAVKTGPAGTHMQVNHQAEAESLVECLEQVSKQVEHANGMKSSVITMPRGNRG